MKSLTIKQLFLIHNFHHRSLDILQTIILRFDGNQWNRKNWRLAMKAKMHVMTRQQDRYIRVTHFSDVHRTLPATAKHTLDHINGLNGRDDINPRVKKFLSKCNNLPQRFFFYSIKGSIHVWDAVISANVERMRYKCCEFFYHRVPSWFFTQCYLWAKLFL